LKVIKAPTVKLNNGIEFPIFGLGTWKVSQLFSASILRIVMCSMYNFYVMLIDVGLPPP
jgi:diketogulonate reductase-like aldo/keto reductase